MQVLLSPLIWSICLFLIGLILKKNSRIWLYSGLVMLYLFSNKGLYQWVISRWEQKSHEKIVLKTPTAVVLGGMCFWDYQHSCVSFNEEADRFIQAISLLQTKKVSKIVFSGGDKNVPEAMSEAELLKMHAILGGIIDTVLFTEKTSLNTYENALYSSRLFEQEGLSKEIILVTSAFHMPRAQRCFERQGFRVNPYAVHTIRFVEPLIFPDYILPNSLVLQRWNLLIKEWVGLLVYNLHGYS